MDRDEVINILRSREVELRAAGFEHLHLFGSVARGDQTPNSDIDLAAEMSTANEWTLLTLGGVQMDLSDWLGADVDLSLLSWFRPSLRERVLQEAVIAF